MIQNPTHAARYLAAALAAFLTCCARAPALRVQPDWRLVPEATVLGQKRQFFLYGRGLDSVSVTVPKTVDMQKGSLSNGGRVLSLHFVVAPLGKDSLPMGETLGSREIKVRTPDTSLVFKLKVVDEALPR